MKIGNPKVSGGRQVSVNFHFCSRCPERCSCLRQMWIFCLVEKMGIAGRKDSVGTYSPTAVVEKKREGDKSRLDSCAASIAAQLSSLHGH